LGLAERRRTTYRSAAMTRHLRLRTCTSAVLGALIALAVAAPAQAAPSSWSSLLGLTALQNASWVRAYAVDTTPTTIYAGTEGSGVFRSLNSGGTWSTFSTGLPAGSNIRTIYPTPGKVYAGTTTGLYSSAAGGSWQPVAQGSEPNPASPIRLNAAVQAVLSPAGTTLLAGTVSGGVYKSGDSGATWKPPAAGNGMPVGTTVWDLTAFGPLVFAATDSGVYRSADAGSTWSFAGDGISGTVLHVIRDGTSPNILYAATAGDGIYRTLNLGVTWVPINDGPGTHDLGNLSTHGLQQFTGPTLTRLYVPTYNGLYTGTTSNDSVNPGPVSWRKVTDTGLNQGNVMWALSSFAGLPGTLLAGTQSNGGYSLTIEPPVNQTLPTITGILTAGETVTGHTGTWGGTPNIDYDYQWQRCGSSSPASCVSIPRETGTTYVLSQAKDSDTNSHIRLKITAHNDFPTAAADPVAYSAVSALITTAPSTLPGYDQLGNPSVSGTPSIPAVGDTLTVVPATISGALLTLAYQWFRCDENGDNCTAIPGATGATYKLVTADGGHRLRVRETASNTHGKATTDLSNYSNQIVPDAAKNVVAPKLHGVAKLGSTLVGDVGTWVSPATTWERQWERCAADGSGCSPIINATNPGYVLTAQDVGQRVRLRVTADVNESYKLPGPTVIYTALSAVVTQPVAPPPPKDTTKPVLQSLKATSAKSSTTLTTVLSEKATLTIVVKQAVKGHKSGSKCKAGTKKHAKSCTVLKSVGTVVKAGAPAGSSTTILGKVVGTKTLKKGSYRATVTPKDAAGNVGAAKTVSFTRK